MSSTETSNEHATQIPTAATVDLKLEVVVIPVSDVDRAKRFYESLGWRLDADFTVGKDLRAVQMTPPGSPCSIHFGKGITTAVPGSAQGMFLVVSDIEAARAELIARGADVSEVFHFDGLERHRARAGPGPGRSVLPLIRLVQRSRRQQLAAPGDQRRGFPDEDSATGPRDADRASARGREHHGEYEPTAPKHHWSGWYAAYIVAREQGKTPEEAAKDATLHIEGTRLAQT